jgi:hypothetical protein
MKAIIDSLLDFYDEVVFKKGFIYVRKDGYEGSINVGSGDIGMEESLLDLLKQALKKEATEGTIMHYFRKGK